MEKLGLTAVGKIFTKGEDGIWQYEIVPGRWCRCNIRTYIYREKLLRAFERDPRFVFEVMIEGYRGEMRKLGLSSWEADFADRMVRRMRPHTKKQKEIMKRIIAKMSTWNLLATELLEGTTERKRFLRYIWDLADIRKLRDEEIMELKKEWYGMNDPQVSAQ